MKLTVILTTLFICSCVFSQDDILEIREHYNNTNDVIKACLNAKDPYTECTYYSDKLVINQYQSSWRAVSEYNRTFFFWYRDVPHLCDECVKENGIDVLDKVEIQEVISIHSFFYELLFKNGELIFCFKSEISEAGNYEERYYFKNGELIKYLQKEDNTNIPIDDIANIDYQIITELAE